MRTAFFSLESNGESRQMCRPHLEVHRWHSAKSRAHRSVPQGGLGGFKRFLQATSEPDCDHAVKDYHSHADHSIEKFRSAEISNSIFGSTQRKQISQSFSSDSREKPNCRKTVRLYHARVRDCLRFSFGLICKAMLSPNQVISFQSRISNIFNLHQIFE